MASSHIFANLIYIIYISFQVKLTFQVTLSDIYEETFLLKQLTRKSC